MGTMHTMKTEAEFVAERMQAHREACEGLDDDPLYKMAMGTHETPPITQRERDQYCLPDGWVFRRQAA